MTDELAIEVENVSKIFKLPHEKSQSIKSLVVSFWRRKRGYELQRALQDMSFDVKKGEFFGIVGRNGSGKSTMLKLLAGIYTPSHGHINVNGKLTPFIELGVGFNPELTGRENVYLNGALLGFSRKEVGAMYKGIVEFAELERFMDQKLKNYSSGMQVRLAFSIAIKAQSEILLIDEVLAVGDLDFQQKCYAYFNDLKRESRTVILVTHDMSAVRRFCDRCMIIDSGKVVEIGAPEEIAQVYERINIKRSEKRLAEENVELRKYAEREGTGEAVIEKVETFNPLTHRPQTTFLADEKIGVRIIYAARASLTSPSIGFIFQDNRSATVFATNNKIKDAITPDISEGQRLTLESIVDNVFTDGEYTIACAIESTDLNVIYDRVEHAYGFLIGGHELSHATTHPAHSFTVEHESKGTAK